ncbi:MAG: diacylglycerol kinase family lipid kinase [Anaerolineales bacterium]|nr:diacylglycerol kinase family lipid kinase [Anaerolineales bacterium]
MRRGCLIYNPAAGRFPSRLLCERAAGVLRAAGWTISLEQTHNGDHIRELTRKAVSEEMDALFVAGGDGSLNRAVPELIGTNTALGVLPAGTANVWAQELGLPGLTWTRWTALEETAHRLSHAKVYSIDVGMCNQLITFLLWAGVGLDAFIVHRIEPRQRWEKHFAILNYAASVVWHATVWRGMNLAVEVDSKQIHGHFLLALVSNVHLYAGGFAQLSPNARLDDATMDLWLFEGETLGDTVQLAWELINGNSANAQGIHQIPFHHLTMQSDSPMFIQLDGEPYDIQKVVTIDISAQSLKVLVPDRTPHPLFSKQ